VERADAARVEPGIMAGNRGGKTLVSVTCDCCQGLTEAGRKVHKLCVETKNKPSDFADLSPVRCSPAVRRSVYVPVSCFEARVSLRRRRCPSRLTAPTQRLWYVISLSQPQAPVVLSGAAAAVFVFVLRDKGTDAAAAGEEAALGSGSRCAACQWG
jgi:hypothetical protein